MPTRRQAMTGDAAERRLRVDWYWWLMIGVIVLPGVALATFVYIIVPLKVWKKMPIQIESAWRPTTAEDVTPEMAQFIQAALGDFRREGFDVVANLTQKDSIPGSLTVQVLLVNWTTGDMGSIVGALVGRARTLLLGVDSEFANGTKVSTVSNSQVGVFPRNGRQETVSIGWTRDVAAVCEFHRRRLRARGRDGKARVTPAPGREIAHADEERRQELERIARAGYLVRDDAAGIYRKTLKGAYLMAWKLTPPIIGWRRKLRDQLAWAEWRRLGMDEWRRPPGAPSQVVACSAAGAGWETSTDPLSIPSAVPDAPSWIVYESRLGEGEVRIQRRPGTTIVQVGGATPGQFLRRQWGSIVWLGVIAVLLMLAALMWWQRYQAYRLMPPALGLAPPRPGVWTLVLLVWWPLEGVRLAASAARARRVVVLTASHASIEFKNAPKGKRDGRIARDDLMHLLTIYHGGIWRRMYQLRAKSYSGTGQILLLGQRKDAVEMVRKALLEGMGIERQADDIGGAGPE